MAKTDDEAVSLAEITDLAWAFVKDRFPQREARARLATALGALMGGSYRQMGEATVDAVLPLLVERAAGEEREAVVIKPRSEGHEQRDRLECEMMQGIHGVAGKIPASPPVD